MRLCPSARSARRARVGGGGGAEGQGVGAGEKAGQREGDLAVDDDGDLLGGRGGGVSGDLAVVGLSGEVLVGEDLGAGRVELDGRSPAGPEHGLVDAGGPGSGGGVGGGGGTS